MFSAIEILRLKGVHISGRRGEICNVGDFVARYRSRTFHALESLLMEDWHHRELIYFY